MPLNSDSLQAVVIIFDMTASLECSYLVFKCLFFLGGKSPVQKSFQDILSGLRCRMAHVFCIESVISKLIHNYFISRKIISLI